jgi:hypothetical protein
MNNQQARIDPGLQELLDNYALLSLEEGNTVNKRVMSLIKSYHDRDKRLAALHYFLHEAKNRARNRANDTEIDLCCLGRETLEGYARDYREISVDNSSLEEKELSRKRIDDYALEFISTVFGDNPEHLKNMQDYYTALKEMSLS